MYEVEIKLIDISLDQLSVLLKNTNNKKRLLDEVFRLVSRRNAILRMELHEMMERADRQ